MRYIDKAENDVWNAIASDLRTASDLVSSAILRLIALKIPPSEMERSMKRIMEAESALSGLAYLFSPQSEWQGNDASDNGLWAIRSPHVCN